jgi:hypothetical protein
MYIILSTYISNFNLKNFKLKIATFIFFESYATIHLFKENLLYFLFNIYI